MGSPQRGGPSAGTEVGTEVSTERGGAAGSSSWLCCPRSWPVAHRCQGETQGGEQCRLHELKVRCVSEWAEGTWQGACPCCPPSNS